MGYRWGYDPKGQYVDGHEHPNVVAFQNKVFLLAVGELLDRVTKWNSKDGAREDPPPGTHCVMICYHDESTFYAHDRRTHCWIHESENAKPYVKGEGHSLMIVDFVSAEYGWL